MQHNANTVGIDLAQQTFHLVGMNTTGKIAWHKRLARQALMPY